MQSSETNQVPENLLPPQAEVFAHGFLDSGFNCVLQMPTGSGKTWLAEQAIEKTLRQNFRAIYLCPLRALAAELSARWRQKFSQYKVGVFTSDQTSRGKTYPVPFQDARLLVMTPERLDACTRFWRSHWSWLPEVDLIVVDELHLLGDARRGARLEGAISRIRRLNPFARILGLSATLGNRSELSAWLGGVDYQSTWRPVPLDWRLVEFKRATEKPGLLLSEVSKNISDGGKSLVFVQSRRRAEQTSEFLRSEGIRSYHHHAGLGYEERRIVERSFLNDEIDVLVATSTLEMGINLPVRQVVLYDLQTFDGTEFRPLPTNNVWQRVGRAGRPGFDSTGEAVLIAPSWDRFSEKYERGEFEPIRSGLARPAALAEQIIAEVSSGMSRTPAQLSATFARSLAARQKVLPDVKTVLDQMIAAGMVIFRDQEDEAQKNNLILSATRLGRIAVRHFLEPSTVQLLRRAIKDEQLTFFDLLLVCAAAADCEPVLPCDYEELEYLSDRVGREPSRLLERAKHEVVNTVEAAGKRLLASLKMALVMRDWCRWGDAETAAEKFNCYPFEVRSLRESFVRLLTAMRAVVEKPVYLDEAEADEPGSAFDEKIRLLLAMVAGGIDEYAATLTMIRGIGPKLANRLKDAGINDLLELAKTDANHQVINLRGINKARLSGWITEAKKLSRITSASDLFETPPPPAAHDVPRQGNRAAVDPYRLRRALELQVKGAEGGAYFVAGGTEPHVVRTAAGRLVCDCLDFHHRSSACKHILAVGLYKSDPDLRRAADKLKENSGSKTIDVFELWFYGQKQSAPTGGTV